MKRWSAGEVLRAAADWVWIPEDADQVCTDEYQLIAYPAGYTHPTQVVWCRSSRPADELIREVATQVGQWGRAEAGWWIGHDTEPHDLEPRLQAAGARLEETVDILAFDVSDGVPDVGVTGSVRCQVVDDEQSLRAANLVAHQVWGGAEPTEEAVAEELAESQRSVGEREGFRVVAFVEDEPAATGGCTRAGAVARLWGAATRPELRGRGAYRATLLKRLEVAREHGATLGLVKGRVGTSGPILRRIGFRAYGQERLYCLAV